MDIERIHSKTNNGDNKMKKKVIILGGGISKERLISLETARSVYKELKKNINGFNLSFNVKDNLTNTGDNREANIALNKVF